MVVRHVPALATLWIPAEALAWALGMFVIFAGIDPAVGRGSRFPTVAVFVLPPSCADAVVGATHCLVLVCLLRRRTYLTLA